MARWPSSGPGWTVERVEAFDDSVGVHSEMAGRLRTMLDQADEAEATARRDLKATEDRLADVDRPARGVAARMDELETELSGRLPYSARERALQQISGLTERLDEQRRIAADAPEADLGAERTRLEQRTRDARELAAALETRATTTGLLASATATAEATAARPWEPYVLPAVLAIAGLVIAVALLLADAPVPAVILVAVGALALAGVLAYLRRPAGVADVERVRSQLQEQLDQADATIARLGPDLGLGAEPTAADVDRLLATLDEERRALEREEARRDRALAASQEVERLTAERATVADGVGLPAEPGPADLEAFSEAIETDRDVGWAADRPAGAGDRTAGHAGDGHDPPGRAREGRERAAGGGRYRARHVAGLAARARPGPRVRPGDRRPGRRCRVGGQGDRGGPAHAGDEACRAAGGARRLRGPGWRPSADLLPAGIAVDADPDGAAVLLGQRLATALDGERARDGARRAPRRNGRRRSGSQRRPAPRPRAAWTRSWRSWRRPTRTSCVPRWTGAARATDARRAGCGRDRDPGHALRAGRRTRRLPGGPGRGHGHRGRRG